VVVFVGGLVALLVFEELVVGLDRLGSAPPALWGVGAALVLLLGWVARAVSTEYLAVGPDWLASRRSWVDLYDLVQVTGSTGAYSMPVLVLRDGSGRRVRRPVSELRADPLMWDLIHLGVRWSRATREVRVNRMAEAVVGDDPLPSGAVAKRFRVAVTRVRRDAPATAELPPRPDP
jgi:hypothetical protein